MDKTCPAGEILQLLELEDGYQLEFNHNVIYSNYYFTSCVERLAKYLHYFFTVAYLVAIIGRVLVRKGLSMCVKFLKIGKLGSTT